MKPSTLLNLVAAANLASAGVVVTKSTEQPTSAALSKRDNCHAGELKVYENNSNFLCIGKTVFWTGVALSAIYSPTINAAASQFATWVTNKFTGAPSAPEGKRDEQNLEIWDEDEQYITYGWTPPTLRTRDGADLSWIHNMTKQFDKTTGFLNMATMTFDAAHDEMKRAISKRASTPITITYYAVSGHQETKLGFEDISNLYTHAFFNAPSGAGSECGYAANSGTWHGAFKITASGCPDAGSCLDERAY